MIEKRDCWRDVLEWTREYGAHITGGRPQIDRAARQQSQRQQVGRGRGQVGWSSFALLPWSR